MFFLGTSAANVHLVKRTLCAYKDKTMLASKLYTTLATNCQISAGMLQHLQSRSFNSTFPDKIQAKKKKNPAHMYLANADSANLTMNTHLQPFFKQLPLGSTVLELNPGIGLLTKYLLDNEQVFSKIILHESMEHFVPALNELHSLYPERVIAKHGDTVSMWKLAYQDKKDNGSRVADLLADIPRREFNKDPNMIIIGAVGAYNFYKHLINSLVFQNSLFNYGRCELYLFVPPPIYIHLTCSEEIGYMLYRSTSILFQILFEHKYIARVPREHFLPAQFAYNLKKSSKLRRVKSINPEYLYLVKMAPRKNIYDLVAPEDMPALWYFVKQNCISRRNRIIPNLEKWIPGCGARLIVNHQPIQKPKYVYDDENIEQLPEFSIRSTHVSINDYFPNMNIYTQFGDLSPSQMLTLFAQFRQWPEYAESSFLASLENSLLKMETSADSSVDGINEEDDVPEETDAVVEDAAAAKSTKKSKAKMKIVVDSS